MRTERPAAPFWLGQGERARFGWLYRPETAVARDTGVLLCPPLGHEYVHSHRSLRHLAERLCGLGFTVVRFDWLGTGDSADGRGARDGLEDWRQDIAACLQLLREQPGVSRVGLFGLRFGAVLAARHAAADPVDFLVLWNPVQRGSAWVRELRALARFALRPAAETDPVVEAAGFPFAQDLLEAIGRCQLDVLQPAAQGGVMLVTESPGAADRFAQAWCANGLPCEARVLPGYEAMMAEPQSTRVPVEAIDALCDWLAGRSGPAQLSLADAAVQPPSVLAFGGIEEEALSGAGVPFCIETRPAPDRLAEGPVLLLCNSGSVHHVGPNRVYVELARDLAAQGVIVRRLDLANLGDSAHGEMPEENHPYPSTAADQALAAAAAARARYPHRPVIVAGLCSGAHTAFHAGLRDREGLVAGVLMINPLTFYWHPGLSLDIPQAHRNAHDSKYYERALLRGSSWRKLLSGQSDYGYLLRFVGTYTVNLLRRSGTRLLEALGLLPQSRLAQDLERLLRDKGVALVVSDTDPGYAILQAEGGLAVRRMLARGRLEVAFVKDADHTFSQRHARQQLREACARLVPALAGTAVGRASARQVSA